MNIKSCHHTGDHLHAQSKRREFSGAVYHVTSRGNVRQDIIRDDQDRTHFPPNQVSFAGNKLIFKPGGVLWPHQAKVF